MKSGGAGVRSERRLPAHLVIVSTLTGWNFTETVADPLARGNSSDCQNGEEYKGRTMKSRQRDGMGIRVVVMSGIKPEWWYSSRLRLFDGDMAHRADDGSFQRFFQT